MMPQLQLITLDVWDTLLRRRCHPDSIKVFLCNYLINNYFDRLRPGYDDAWKLLAERQRAEGSIGARYRDTGMDDEYHIREVFRHWLAVVLDGDDDIEAIVDALEAAELQQEKRVIYADPDIEAFLAMHSASARIFVSDFYMSADKLMELIRHAGLEHLVERGYSSCDHYLNKRSGRLFGFVHDKEGTVAGSTLHIGDNLHSDVAMPKRLGAAALAYLPEAESRLRNTLKQEFEHRSNRRPPTLAAPGAADAESSTALARQLYTYGQRCAPLIVGFVLFAMEQAIRHKHEKIYFFTREGEFFREIYDRLNAVQPLGQPGPPSELLEVSRLATFAPSLRALTTAELMRIWNLYGTQSLTALMKSLNVDPALAAPHAARHGIDMTEAIQYPWLDARVAGLFDDAAFLRPIEAEIAHTRRRALQYLAHRGLTTDSRQAAIVDIGWRGTIQDNLAYLLPQCRFDGIYLGLERVLNEQPANCRKTAFGPDLNKPEWQHLPTFFRVVAPLEMLCNSPNGSVTGYRDDAPAAIRMVDEAENASFHQYVAHFQQGVAAATAELGETIAIHALSSAELREPAVGIWRDIVERPNPAVGTAYFQLNHNEQFGLGAFMDKRSRIPARVWARALVSPRYLRELTLQLEATGWPEGYLARNNLGFVWSALRAVRRLRHAYRIRRQASA